MILDAYRHRPGNHCGSTALRNLFAFDGVEISEEMALGLGAGVCFYYLHLDGRSPSRFTNGRVGRLEEQFLELTRAGLRLDTFDSPEESWDAARQAVDDGRPALDSEATTGALGSGPLLVRGYPLSDWLGIDTVATLLSARSEWAAQSRRLRRSRGTDA